MGTVEIIKKFIKSSYVLEKTALEIYERMPLSCRYRVFYGPAFLRWLALLKESDNWGKDRFYSYQFEQTRNLLVYSMRNVPYYRELFSSLDFRPEKIQSLENLKMLPYLYKETVRDKLNELIDDSVPQKYLFKKSTSGSTGIPMTIYRSRESIGAFLAFRVNLLGRAGYTPKSRECIFWNMIEFGKKKNLPYMKYGNKLIFSNRYLTDEWLLKYIDMIRGFKPEFIAGFPSSLTVLSAFIKRNGSSLPKGLKVVISYAETLYDWQRQIIEDVFGVRVFSMYAMAELQVIGGECEYSNSLHFYPQYGLTEFDVLNYGHKEIVATGFTNYTMPLIRYKTGDIVIKEKEFCHKCGRNHQIVDNIEGRINDFLVNKEGKIIPRIMPWIKIFPNTRQYQFFQEEPGKAYLKIIRAETFSGSDTIYIKSKLEEMLGTMKDSIDIELVYVENIPKISIGKIKLVDQKLDIREFLNA